MSTNAAPPLNINFAAIDTTFQLLADGVYDLRIEKAEMKPTQAGGKMLHLELVTVAPAPSRGTGEQLNPGVRVFHNQNTRPTGKATWEIVLNGPSGLGALLQTAGIADQMHNVDEVEVAGVNLLKGRQVVASVGFEPAGTSKQGKPFKEKNVIKYWITKR